MAGEVSGVTKPNTCMWPHRRNRRLMRRVSTALLVVGGLIILIAVPIEFWIAMLGATLLAAGVALLMIA